MVAVWWRPWITAADEVRKHYLRLWGEPSRTAEFRIEGRGVEIYKWDAARNPEQVNLYVTLGISNYPLPGHGPGHRLEFFLGLNPAQDGVAKPLAMVGLDPVLHGTELAHGHTVTYPEPLWKGTKMRSFLILRPVTEIVPPLVLNPTLDVEFLQAIPLFPSEVAFKSKHRIDGLLDRWRAAKVPFWNPNRQADPLTPNSLS